MGSHATAVIKIILSLVISICSFIGVYAETTDYEYTNILNDVDLDAIANENPNTFLENPDLVIDLGNFDPNNTIGDTSSSQDILSAIDQAEQNGDIDNLEVDFSNMNIVESFNYMKSINNQTAGWLYIPNQGSYSVMYSGDNSFYLTHSAYGYEFENGAIFMNRDSGGTFSDTALLHGHHLRTGGMFGSLKKYKDSYFFQKNDLVEVYDGEYLKYYRPFSVFFYEDGVEGIPQQFLDNTQKKNYFESIYNRSMVKMDSKYTPRFDTDILMLSTCDYEFENCRLCVALYCVTSVKFQQ